MKKKYLIFFVDFFFFLFGQIKRTEKKVKWKSVLFASEGWLIPKPYLAFTLFAQVVSLN